METYIDFGVSYFIQKNLNKYKIMKWLSSYPHPRISNFEKENFTFYETSENVLFE